MSTVVIARATAANPTLTFEQIGDDTVSGGHGGWETLPRPGRPDMTAWVGTPGTTWQLPLSLDGYGDSGERSVESDLALLESWALPTDDTGEPPALYVQAPVGRGRATVRWVIASIELGEQIRNPYGQRLRQDLTLTLLAYQPGQILKGPAAKSRSKNKGKNAGKDKGKNSSKSKGKGK